MSSPYTNKKVTKPYASRGAYTNLTPKERLVRRMKKQASFPVNTIGGANTVLSSNTGFFSPMLSTDFLELPQSQQERWEIYRHFYNTDPIVGQAIDLHTELPLSKIRLSPPKPTTCPEWFDSPEDYGRYIFNFFERMSKRIKLFQNLILGVHHYWLDGTTYFFAEDTDVEIPPEVGYEKKVSHVLLEGGTPAKQVDLVERPDREEAELAYYRKHYQGIGRLMVLPIAQVKTTTYGLTDKMRVEFIPSDQDRELLRDAQQGDEYAQQLIDDIPEEMREYLLSGEAIPLNTNPDEGSFVYALMGRKNTEDSQGQSLLDRVLRTLYYREKLRQAQTQIASRAMTPKRLVWAEGISVEDTEQLRDQVDLALIDPDYTIVTNYEIHWEDLGARDRLLDLSTEYDRADKDLYTGLGVTESLMNGESVFGGERLKLEVINTRYLFLREVLQWFVEEALFRPVAIRKGFVEKDKWGDDVVLYPKLRFTRLPLRDSQDMFDALLNLYQKGSISIDLILELFNIDPVTTREKIEDDMFTVNDSAFNDVIRGIYGEAGRTLVEKTDVVDKLAKYMNLEVKQGGDDDDGGRF